MQKLVKSAHKIKRSVKVKVKSVRGKEKQQYRANVSVCLNAVSKSSKCTPRPMFWEVEFCDKGTVIHDTNTIKHVLLVLLHLVFCGIIPSK